MKDLNGHTQAEAVDERNAEHIQLIEGWQALAACRNEDPTQFYTEGDHRSIKSFNNEAAAKAICAICVVRSPCLTASFTESGGFGVWGGLNEDERRALTNGQNRRVS